MIVEIIMKISNLFEIFNTHYFLKKDKEFFNYITKSKKINEILKEVFNLTDSAITENLNNDKNTGFLSSMMNKKLNYKKNIKNIKIEDDKNIDLVIMIDKRKEKIKKVTHLSIDFFIKENKNSKKYTYYHLYFHNTIESKEFKSILTLTKQLMDKSNTLISDKLIKNDLYCSIVSKQNRVNNNQEVSLNEIRLYSNDNKFITYDRPSAIRKNPKLAKLDDERFEEILFFGGIDSVANDVLMLSKDNFDFDGYSKVDGRSVFDIVVTKI